MASVCLNIISYQLWIFALDQVLALYMQSHMLPWQPHEVRLIQGRKLMFRKFELLFWFIVKKRRSKDLKEPLYVWSMC